MQWAVELFTWKETRYKKQLVVKSQNDALCVFIPFIIDTLIPYSFL